MLGRRDDMELDADASFAGDRVGHLDQEPDIEELLLRALAQMALRSKRRQADLGAVLRASGLKVGRDRILVALDALGRRGYVEQVVPLSDGGMLLSVTTRGVERLGPPVHWDVTQPSVAAAG